MSNTYNGWTNYATWRVNLEFFDGYSSDIYSSSKNVNELAADLKYYIEDYFEQTAIDCKQAGTSIDAIIGYAQAFLSDVNWTEIAKGMLENEEVEA